MRAFGLALVLLPVTAVASPAWQWDHTTPDLFPRVDLVVSGIRLAQVEVGGRDQLRLSGDVWSVALGRAELGDLSGAALAIGGDRICVATYNRIATGCQLAAFARFDGHWLWSVDLVG